MERLCDEVIQIVFYELPDPGPLTHVNKRFYRFSREPYVRAHYFLTHYGSAEAMFHALGRGKVLDERVLDILLTSGAHLSRYLVQVSMHHYFHTASHFIKSPWVRTVPLGVFLHFLKLAEEIYGNIPRAKNEDDGYIFNTFLKQSRWPSSLKTVNWDTIREILEKYNFIPFSNRDPLMAQFPLALAIEPRLLPYAVRNGFYMDRKYRDFVFRKMFERTASANDTASEEIVHNVRELCRLDHSMFVSRTVAAEVCMEAKVNVAGYQALKVLDKSGDLRFELGDLVEDLIKTFANTRSICYPTSIEPLRLLYSDYPSSNPTARLVMLVIFFNAIEINTSPGTIHTKLEARNLTPITRKDVFNILLNPFISHPQLVIDYASSEMGHPEEERKGMSTKEVRKLVKDVVSICLEVPCKGNLLSHLDFRYEFVKDLVKEVILKYHITVEDLPPSDDFVACRKFEAKLSQDHTMFNILGGSKDILSEHDHITSDTEHCVQLAEPSGEGNSQDMDVDNSENAVNLGGISQETLTTMIRQDEVMPVMRSRRRVLYHSVSSSEIARKLPYPSDIVPVGHWIKQTFGPRSRLTAIFMTHAVVNNSNNILDNFLSGFGSAIRRTYPQPSERVPVTLKHFKMLARLGKIPNHHLYTEIFKGCEFYFDEEDYIQDEDTSNTPVKMEASSALLCPSNTRTRPEASASSSTDTGGRKRPRRTATTIKSYAIPDSDDEGISDDNKIEKKPRIQESNLQKWIFHLGELLKEEKWKHKEQKRKHNALLEPGAKTRVYKSDFYKSLSLNLRELRLKEEAKRMALYGHTIPQNDGTDEDDDEYPQTTRTKRRKTTRNL